MKLFKRYTIATSLVSLYGVATLASLVYAITFSLEWYPGISNIPFTPWPQLFPLLMSVDTAPLLLVFGVLVNALLLWIIGLMMERLFLKKE